VYVALLEAHGSDCSWRPSTANGVMASERSGFITTVPCWNCIMPCGHFGSEAGHSSALLCERSDTSIRLTVGNRSEICLFVKPICCEGVGNAGMAGFDEAIVDRIIEALYPNILISPHVPSYWLLENASSHSRNRKRTGPVMTFADFVDHVPTSWLSIAAVAEEIRHAPASRSDCREREAIVGSG